MKLKLDEIIAQIEVRDSVSTFQAVLNYCEEKQLDPSQIAKKLSPGLVEKITRDAGRLHLLRK